MRVLIACEYSGRVREAFRKKGHTVLSCDLLPSDQPGSHYQGDVMDVINDGWDLMIAHPPCTALCVSGNRYYAGTQARLDGAAFVQELWDADIPKICIENPVGVINSINKDMSRPQYIQPWQFGHGETKKTGLWLKGLPELQPTNIVEGREQKVWKMPPSADRWKLRSLTYQGVADAMAEQWGGQHDNSQLAVDKQNNSIEETG